MSVCVSLRLGSQNDERVATPYPLRPFSTQRPFSLVLEEASFLPEEVLRYTYVTSVKESFISHTRSHALNILATTCQIFSKKRQSIRRFVLLATMSMNGVVWSRVIRYNGMEVLWRKDVVACCNVLYKNQFVSIRNNNSCSLNKKKPIVATTCFDSY